MVNHSALCMSIKCDYINILTWTILKKIQILNGCETFAFKYSFDKMCIKSNFPKKFHFPAVATFQCYETEDDSCID